MAEPTVNLNGRDPALDQALTVLVPLEELVVKQRDQLNSVLLAFRKVRTRLQAQQADLELIRAVANPQWVAAMEQATQALARITTAAGEGVEPEQVQRATAALVAARSEPVSQPQLLVVSSKPGPAKPKRKRKTQSHPRKKKVGVQGQIAYLLKRAIGRSEGFPNSIEEALTTAYGQDYALKRLSFYLSGHGGQSTILSYGEDIGRGGQSWVRQQVAQTVWQILHPEQFEYKRGLEGIAASLRTELGEDQAVRQAFRKWGITIPE